MLVTPFKNSAVIIIAGGAACAFTGYLIEEYAHYAMIAALAAGLAYGGFWVGLHMEPKKFKDVING